MGCKGGAVENKVGGGEDGGKEEARALKKYSNDRNCHSHCCKAHCKLNKWIIKEKLFTEEVESG